MRPVITGLGTVCALGWSYRELLTKLDERSSGIKYDECTGLPLATLEEIPHLTQRSSESWDSLAAPLSAIREACQHAELSRESVSRAWLLVGTNQAPSTLVKREDGGYSVATCLADSFVRPLAQQAGILGRTALVETACTSSLHALMLAALLVSRGHADVIIAGGCDLLSPQLVGGFKALRALDPKGCSPYGRSQGITLGEGAAFFVVEPERRRDGSTTPILAHIAGWGATADGHHPTAPHPGGDGARRAVQSAFQSAGHSANSIGYIHTHGTGTAANDRMELGIIDEIVKERGRPIPFSGSKSVIGHTLGASGALETAIAMRALEGSAPIHVIPSADVESCTTNGLVLEPDTHIEPRALLKVSFGFGGNNAAIILERAIGDSTTPVAFARASILSVATLDSADSNAASKQDPFAEIGVRLAATCLADVADYNDATNTAVIVVTRLGAIATAVAMDAARSSAPIVQGIPRVGPGQFSASSPTICADSIATRFQLLGPNLTLVSTPDADELAFLIGIELVETGAASAAMIALVDCGGPQPTQRPSVAVLIGKRSTPNDISDLGMGSNVETKIAKLEPRISALLLNLCQQE
jgi:3-oxoacyl-(acyl-carrier-protein) synthase